MTTFTESAPAKVNLFLHVGRKRADGYHDLTSLVVFPELGDMVSAAPAKTSSFTVAGPFARDLEDSHAPLPSFGRHSPQHVEGRFQNLVLRAAGALAEGHAAPETKITLTKNLPIASGIGGGSTDAAATLRILNGLWRLRLSRDALRAIGLRLGSDVPVCIDPKPQWMEGRGERVERGPRMPEFYVVLVNPGVPVPTAGVFKALAEKSGSKRPQAPKSFSSARSLSAWLVAETRNDLERPAAQIAPQIADVLSRLGVQPGCLLARMSGSGATCFGVFDTLREAKRAARAMPGHWWAKAAKCS